MSSAGSPSAVPVGDRLVVEPRADRRRAARRRARRRRAGDASRRRRSRAASRRPTSTSRRRAGSGSTPTRCAAVEDSHNGIRSAKAAGMRVFAVPNPHFPPGDEALGARRRRARLARRADRRAALVDGLAVVGHEHAVDRAVGLAALEAVVHRLEVHDDDSPVGRRAHARARPRPSSRSDRLRRTVRRPR